MEYIFLAGLLAALMFIYVSFIVPNRLDVHQIKLEFENKTQKGEYKIVHFSDVHIGAFISDRMLKRLVDTINAQNSDIVAFTGDLLDANTKNKPDFQKAAELLSKINAPLGKYAVRGNHEWRAKRLYEYSDILEKSGFKLLVNEWTETKEAGICVVGLDEYKSFDADTAFSGVNRQNFLLALCHQPDLADKIAAKGADVILSGHSHGGQVALPFIGAILLPNNGKKYPRGLYRVNESWLNTSEGVGTTRLPFRFLASPAISVITLRFI